MTTILVTGGCGFIASHFIRLILSQTNWRVINLDAITYAGNMENLEDILSNPNHVFYRGDIISIKSNSGTTFAWGISNYASNDIKLIKGKGSKNITELINKKYEPEIIHRDNLVISRES